MITRFSVFGVEVIVFRDDLNHPTISGNKLHKLSPNIAMAKDRYCSKILSFGGPYSNHLHALAWACQEAGLESIGVVRGELSRCLTPTLADCQNWGMHLIPISRARYRNIQSTLSASPELKLASELSPELSGIPIDSRENTLVVPEGGSNRLAIDSLSDAYQAVIDSLSPQKIGHAVCATGTGATLAGLYLAAPEYTKILGMQAVAEGDATLKRVQAWLNRTPSGLSILECHLGRFAKITPELNKFIEQFETEHDIPLDPIYTGKAMYKLMGLLHQGYFKKGETILFLHTGGLQGKRGEQYQSD